MQARPAAADLSLPGTGWRRLQLIVGEEPSEGLAWEVRQQDSRWLLFLSRITESVAGLLLLGYEPVPFDSGALASYYGRIGSLRLPLSPLAGDELALDGDMTQVAVYGALYSECRFRWWSEPPPQWLPLVDIADKMMGAFAAALERRGAEAAQAPNQSLQPTGAFLARCEGPRGMAPAAELGVRPPGRSLIHCCCWGRSQIWFRFKTLPTWSLLRSARPAPKATGGPPNIVWASSSLLITSSSSSDTGTANSVLSL